MNAFIALIDARRQAIGLSQNALARAARIDPGYLTHLRRRHRAPSRPVVLALASVLKLDALDTDRLLFAAGLATERDWQAVATDYAWRFAAIDRALVGVVELPAAERQEAAS